MTGPSKRAFEVLDLLVAGNDIADIAARLHVGEHTVSNHLTDLRRHHGARHTIALIALVRDAREAPLRAELDRCQRDLRALDRRGKGQVSTVDVIGQPMGQA